jgi:hypothetical protein
MASARRTDATLDVLDEARDEGERVAGRARIEPGTPSERAHCETRSLKQGPWHKLGTGPTFGRRSHLRCSVGSVALSSFESGAYHDVERWSVDGANGPLGSTYISSGLPYTAGDSEGWPVSSSASVASEQGWARCGRYMRCPPGDTWLSSRSSTSIEAAMKRETGSRAGKTVRTLPVERGCGGCVGSSFSERKSLRTRGSIHHVSG